MAKQRMLKGSYYLQISLTIGFNFYNSDQKSTSTIAIIRISMSLQLEQTTFPLNLCPHSMIRNGIHLAFPKLKMSTTMMQEGMGTLG